MARHRTRNSGRRGRGHGRGYKSNSSYPSPRQRLQQVVGDTTETIGQPQSSYWVNSIPEHSFEYIPRIFSEFPNMAGRLPWVSLRGCSNPSVPKRILRAQHFFGDNYVYIKNETDDFHTLPDNKARKLEFILGDALARRRRKLVTFGYVGSSHCLATVKAASQLGLKSEAILLKAPLTPTALETTAAMKNLGAKLRFRTTWRGMIWTAAWKWLCSKIFRTELIPPGGSNSHGVLGYVSAMLELRDQIRSGQIPMPDFLFVAAGSGATVVGMELGRRLFEMTSLQVIGVQTSHDRGVEPERLAAMANEAIRILNSYSKAKLPENFVGKDFKILRDFTFGGHGLTDPDLDRWVSTLSELETFSLDPVYTANAFYGMRRFIEEKNVLNKVFLFWNTTSPFRRGDLPPSFSYKKIPWKLKRWVRSEQKGGQLMEVGRL